MKVFFFVDYFPKLSETFIVQQIVGFVEAGYEVKIIADRRGSQNELQPIVNQYGLISKVIVPAPAGYFRKLFPTLKFCIFHPRFTLSYRFTSRYHLYTLLQLPYLRKLDIKENDIVISNFGPNGIKAAQLLKLGMDFKLITIFHGYDMSSFLRSEPKNVYKDVFRYSDRILPCSKFWASKLGRMGCPAEKINVYHYGIDLDDFTPAKKVNKKQFTLLSIGRFVEKKGFLFSIKAYAEFTRKNKVSNSTYKIIGSGPLADELKELAKNLGLEDSVKFLGSRDTAQIKKILQSADVVVVPSVTAKNGDMEGIPNVMLEAQSMEVPVISTKHSGMSEGIINNKTGILVNERGTTELASAMKRLYSEPRLRVQFGAQGRKFIKERFNAEIQRTELVNIAATLR